MATFLDPRFVSLTPFVPEYDRASFGRDVLIALKEIAEDICLSEPNEPEVPPEIATSSSDMPSPSPLPKKRCVDPNENPFYSLQVLSFIFPKKESVSFMAIPDRSNADDMLVSHGKESLKSKVQVPFSIFPPMSWKGKGIYFITKEFKLFSKTRQIDPKADPLQWWQSQLTVFLLGFLLFTFGWGYGNYFSTFLKTFFGRKETLNLSPRAGGTPLARYPCKQCSVRAPFQQVSQGECKGKVPHEARVG